MRNKNFDFIGHKKIFFGISIGLILIGIVCNLIFKTQLDINFTGGALIKYSYTGEISDYEAEKAISQATGQKVAVDLSTSLATDKEEGDEGKRLTVSFTAEASDIDEKTTDDIVKALNKIYPDSKFERLETNIVDPTMGSEFLLKCVVAILLACFFMILYVGVRFRKIGGLSAGVMSIAAILHDILIVYFVFIVLRYPIDDNFVAVVLSIIGYSLNSTIVVFDRIRENRRLMGPKATIAEVTNRSINQTLGRTINTNICVFLAILTIVIVAKIYDLNSIMTFAVPMMFGTVSGCYSSVVIASPLWVTWNEHKAAKKAKANKK